MLAPMIPAPITTASAFADHACLLSSRRAAVAARVHATVDADHDAVELASRGRGSPSRSPRPGRRPPGRARAGRPSRRRRPSGGRRRRPPRSWSRTSRGSVSSVPSGCSSRLLDVAPGLAAGEPVRGSVGAVGADDQRGARASGSARRARSRGRRGARRRRPCRARARSARHDRELRLGHLDRDVRSQAGGVREAVVAVAGRRPAPGADDELVEDEPVAAVGRSAPKIASVLPPSPAAGIRSGISCASAPLSASRMRKPVTPRIDEAPGITTSATVPGFVRTWIGLNAPAVFGTSRVSAQRTAW